MSAACRSIPVQAHDTVVGIDSYITSDATDATISTGAGDDLIDLSLEFSTVHGGDGNDTITVGGGLSEVYGGAKARHFTNRIARSVEWPPDNPALVRRFGQQTLVVIYFFHSKLRLIRV